MKYVPLIYKLAVSSLTAFDVLKVPSVTEITAMSTALTDIDQKAAQIKTAITTYIEQQSRCTIA